MKKFLSTFVLIIFGSSLFAQLKVQNLVTEHLVNPVGIGVAQPRFGWQLSSDKKSVSQAGYEIIVSSSSSKAAIWKSGKVLSDSSVDVVYQGAPLQSGTRYSWQVRVWDNSGAASAWSEAAIFQTALFYDADGKAKWIEPGFTEDPVNRPAVMFRRKFDISKKIKSATLYVTAHGMYEIQLNGKRVGDAYLAPGWTSYNKRLQYQEYDVTAMLNSGGNAVGAMVGSGWYGGLS